MQTQIATRTRVCILQGKRTCVSDTRTHTTLHHTQKRHTHRQPYAHSVHQKCKHKSQHHVNVQGLKASELSRLASKRTVQKKCPEFFRSLGRHITGHSMPVPKSEAAILDPPSESLGEQPYSSPSGKTTDQHKKLIRHQKMIQIKKFFVVTSIPINGPDGHQR